MSVNGKTPGSIIPFKKPRDKTLQVFWRGQNGEKWVKKWREKVFPFKKGSLNLFADRRAQGCRLAFGNVYLFRHSSDETTSDRIFGHGVRGAARLQDARLMYWLGTLFPPVSGGKSGGTHVADVAVIGYQTAFT